MSSGAPFTTNVAPASSSVYLRQRIAFLMARHGACATPADAEAQGRAAKILADHTDELTNLRDELLKVKTIEPNRVAEIIERVRNQYPTEFSDLPPSPPAGEGLGVRGSLYIQPR